MGDTTVSVAILFPGQGEQREGMLRALPPTRVDYLAVASAVLGEDVAAMDSDQTLASTRSTQLALLIAGSAWADAARIAGLSADYVAGHSVGMWTAAVAADAIDFSDAVRLVDIRARAMAQASPPDSGMIAIDGLSAHSVDTTATRLRTDGGEVWLSNVNSATQVTVSGALADLDTLAELLKSDGARRIVRLPVAVPAHTSLMRPAADAVGHALAEVAVRKPSVPIAGNLSGQTLFTAAQLRAELVASITRGVQWSTAVAILGERGVDTWVQAPPGRALLTLTPAGGLAIAASDLSVREAAHRVAARR